MKSKHTLRSLLSMVCTIAMIISMVPVLPAAAAEEDLLFDNMESYTVGADLYTQAPDKYTQKSPSWNSVKDAGGSATVVADPDNSNNKVIAISTPGGDATRYVLATAPQLTSEYTLQFDYRPGNSEGNPNSGFMDVYINQGMNHTARIASGLYNTYFNLDKASCSNTIKNAELDLKDQWYSVRIVVTPGQYVMDIWEKGKESTMLTCTTTKGTKAIEKAYVEFCIGPYLESQQVGDTDKPITNYIDNIRITPGVVEATDPSEGAEGAAVAGGGMVEFVDEYIIENKDAVAVTAGMGIFTGKEGNRFDPQGQLTRAEMATVIVKMLRGNAFNADNFKGADTFPDTADYQGGWAEGYINACVQMGIVKGYGDGTFKPGNPVNTAEALTMIINALKVDAGEGSWPETIMAKAQDMKLYGDLAAKPNTYDVLTRDQLAVLVYEGMCYSPSGATGWKVDGRDTIFENYADAMKFGDPIEVKGEDSLASKIYEMQIVEGYIVANQDTSDNKYTTIQTVENGTLGVEMKFNMKTALDRIGHYVTVYYREDWNGEQDPGVVYNYVDKTEVITVEKTLTSKDYKEVFYEKYKPANKVAHFDGDYTWDADNGYGALSTAKYVAGTKAVPGTYFIREGEIVGYMAPVTVYADQVEAVNNFEDDENIVLKAEGIIKNSEDHDYVREYKGIAKDDYVTYTKVGDGEDTIYVLTKAIEVKGAVSKQTTKDLNDVVTVNGVEYVQFDGPGSNNEENNIDEFVADGVTEKFTGEIADGTYLFYLTEDGKYIGFEETEDTLGMDQTVFILGQVEVDSKDKYSQTIRQTYARGVDMSGNEVMLLVRVQKNGTLYPGGAYKPTSETIDANNVWDTSFEEKFNFKLAENTFYTYELSTESEAKKENIYKLEAVPTAYVDEITTPIYAGTHTYGNNAKMTFNGGTYGGKLTYSSASIVCMTLEGTKDQDEPLQGVTEKLWATHSNVSGGDQTYYMLFSRNEEDGQIMEAIILLKDEVKLAGTVIYVSEEGRNARGSDANGYVYPAYDYLTGAKKDVTLSYSSKQIDSAGYWHLTPEEDSTAYILEGKVVDTGKFNYSDEADKHVSKDKLYGENILHNQVMSDLYNNQLWTVYTDGAEGMVRGQKANAAVVLDTRNEDQIKAGRVGKVTSIDRIFSLSKIYPEISVVFDMCYAMSGSKLATVFVKDLAFASTDETTIMETNGTYYIDGREVAEGVDIGDLTGRVGEDIDMSDLIAARDTYTVAFSYEIGLDGKINAITVNSALNEEGGELFFEGFDGYEPGKFTGTTVSGTSAAKYTSVTTETIGGVKALKVTAKGADSDKMAMGSSVSGSFVWETRMKVLENENGYTTIYTTGIESRSGADKAFANFQLQVKSGGVSMYRKVDNVTDNETVSSTTGASDWLKVRVTVTNLAGTAKDEVLIELFDKSGAPKGELSLSGDDELKLKDAIGFSFDVRGEAATEEAEATKHTIAIDYVQVTALDVDDPDPYTVAIEQEEEGYILTDVDAAFEGDEVAVTAYPIEGYKLNSLKVVETADTNVVVKTLVAEGADLSERVTKKFTMPAKDVTVVAEFIAITGSKVIISYVDDEDQEKGEITVTNKNIDLNDVTEGTKLAIKAAPEAGYAISYVKVGAEEITENNGIYYYTVPAGGADVEITAKFDVGHTVTYEAEVDHGKVSVNKTFVAEGVEVTIKTTPDKYYKVNTVTVGDEVVTDNEDGTYTFEMPASDVTVEVEFEIIKYTVTPTFERTRTTVKLDGNSATTGTAYTVNAGESVTIAVTETASWVLKDLLVNNEKIAEDKLDATGTGRKTYTYTIEKVEADTIVTVIPWPRGTGGTSILFYEDFDLYANGNYDLTDKNNTLNEGSNYKDTANHTVTNKGLTLSAGTGGRSVVKTNVNFKDSYTVEIKLKPNPGDTGNFDIYLNSVGIPRLKEGKYSTTRYDLRFSKNGEFWLEVNAALAAGTDTGDANLDSTKGNKIEGSADTTNHLFLYPNGNTNNQIADGDTKLPYTANQEYTVKITVDAAAKTVTTELLSGSTVRGSRTLYDAVLGEGTIEIESANGASAVIDSIKVTKN